MKTKIFLAEDLHIPRKPTAPVPARLAKTLHHLSNKCSHARPQAVIYFEVNSNILSLDTLHSGPGGQHLGHRQDLSIHNTHCTSHLLHRASTQSPNKRAH